MTVPPVGGDKGAEDGERDAPAAAVVCVFSESFLEKRGRDGEWRGRSVTMLRSPCRITHGCLVYLRHVSVKV